MRYAYLTLFLFSISLLLRAEPSAVRNLPDYYVSGKEVKVEIEVNPGEGALAWVIEDIPPCNWEISRIENEGVWDSSNKKVKWGLFMDSDKRNFSYYLLPPENETKNGVFDGIISINGDSQNISGEKTLESGKNLLIRYILGCEDGRPIDYNIDEKVDAGDLINLIK